MNKSTEKSSTEITMFSDPRYETAAPSNNIMNNLGFLVFAVPKIPLNANCELGDECADVSAECSDQTCQCKENFFDRNGICSKKMFHCTPRYCFNKA